MIPDPKSLLKASLTRSFPTRPELRLASWDYSSNVQNWSTSKLVANGSKLHGPLLLLVEYKYGFVQGG